VLKSQRKREGRESRDFHLLVGAAKGKKGRRKRRGAGETPVLPRKKREVRAGFSRHWDPRLLRKEKKRGGTALRRNVPCGESRCARDAESYAKVTPEEKKLPVFRCEEKEGSSARFRLDSLKRRSTGLHLRLA